jgi:hypothetical protein
MNGLYGTSSESTGLYGVGAASGGTYFEWIIFQDSLTQPATPTGGTWNFQTNTGTAPAGWLSAPIASPTQYVWTSIAIVDSRTSTLTWSVPGVLATQGATAGANSNITSLSGITGGISTPDFVQFDTGITPTVGVGKLQWDSTWGCMQVGMTGGNVNLLIGEETVVYIYNNTGSTISKGQAVKVLGSQGQRLTVALAQANSDANSATILGIATENIANNASGFVTTQGLISNISTSGWADGTLLYLSPTVAGGLTSTKPIAPQHLVWMGYVVKGNSGGAGSIYIHTQNGYELDELHDVRITSVADTDLLQFDDSVACWVNRQGMKIKTSTTPSFNQNMVFELTSNTTLTIKVKGTDGTVRSATLTLA